MRILTPMVKRWIALALLAKASVLAALGQTNVTTVFERGARFARTAYALDALPVAPLWDVRHLVRQAADDQTIELVDPPILPISSAFSDANLVERITANGDTLERYWQQTESELRLLGQIQLLSSGPVVVAQAYRLAALPLIAGYSAETAMNSQVTASGLTLARTGKIYVQELGRGTLMLPRGRVPGVVCLEIRQEIDQQANLTGVAHRHVTRTLAYLAPGYGYPLLTLTEETAYSGDSAHTRRLALMAERLSTATPERWLPHLAIYGGNFATEVLLRNGGTEAATIWLTPYDQSGKALSSLGYTLGAGTVMALSHEDLGTNASHVAIAGGPQISATVGYRAAAGGGTAHLQAARAETSFLVYRGDTELLFDGLAIVNLDTQAAQVSAQLLDDQGVEQGAVVLAENLAPGAKLLADLGQALGDLPGRLIRVVSDRPVGALFLRGSRDGRYLYPNAPLIAGADERRWLPHLATYNGDFDSEVWLHNTGLSAASVRLTPYVQGRALAPFALTLAPRQTRVVGHAELDPQAEYVAIEGAVECVASTAYRARSGGATAQIPETGAARTWLAWPGEAQLLWDGLAVANTSGQAAVFRAELLDQDGSVLASTSSDLASQAKFLTNLSQALAVAPGRVLRLSADRELALVLLRGSLDGRHLYPNNPLSGL